MKKFVGCPSEWQPKVLLKVLRGSQAHGLVTEQSDTDTSTVFLQPTRAVLSMYEPNKFAIDKSEDATGWELEHFLFLATNANPSVLEVFLAPVLESLPEAVQLRKLMPFAVRKTAV